MCACRKTAQARAGAALAAALLATALAACGGSRSEPATLRGAGLELSAALEPAAPRLGENTLWLQLRDAQGRPVEGARVEVLVQMPAMGGMSAMGGPVPVEDVGGGRFRADFALAMGGSWLVEVSAESPVGSVRGEGSLAVGTPGLRFVGGAPAGHVHGVAPPPPAGRPAGSEHPAEFQLPLERLQRIGVRSEPVVEKPFATHVRAVGRVGFDETALEDVSLKVRGWVGELGVAATGDPVERGQVLFTLYSPELYSAQQEYLQALRSRERARATGTPDRADFLVRAARNRLRLWDLAPEELERLERSGEPVEEIAIRARTTGFVIEKDIVAGSAVEPGQRLYRIAPLDRVWVDAQVYEREIPLVEVGRDVRVTLSSLPDREYSGRIARVYPALAGETRTARVRVELPNPDLALRPGMWADVHFAQERGPRLVVSQSAVLHAGERDFVFVDLGEGRFRPRQVRVGLRAGEELEVLEGLAPGERVVVAGTFLIASESRLRAALEQW